MVLTSTYFRNIFVKENYVIMSGAMLPEDSNFPKFCFN